jgi:hypothetical protein
MRIRTLAPLAGACVLLAAFAAAPASGEITHVLAGPLVSFAGPGTLAVDQSNGDVYVHTAGVPGEIKRFDSSGSPDDFTAGPAAGTNALPGFRVAIAPPGSAGGTAGDIYVATLFGAVEIYGPDGVLLGQITEANGSGLKLPCGVAVDSSGRVYVGEGGGSVLDRYVPSANPATNAGYDSQVAGVSLPCGLAVDSTGAVYNSPLLLPGEPQPLTKYPASDFGTSNPGTQLDAASTAVYVDPSSDHVYVDEGTQIAEFDSSGKLVDRFGAGAIGSSGGVAVKGGGDVYVSDATAGQVSVFGPPVVVPDVVTRPSTNNQPTSTTLNGAVNPDGIPVTGCRFEYVSDTLFRTNGYADPSTALAPCLTDEADSASIGAGTSPVAVHADLSGLSPFDFYHFRLVASNENGTNHGADAVTDHGFGFLPGSAGAQSSYINQDGSPATQAGSHPYDFTTQMVFNTTTLNGVKALAGGNPKTIRVALPPGLIGNPGATPKCEVEDFGGPDHTPCPVDTIIGQAVTGVEILGRSTNYVPIYNLPPPPGVPAEFGFLVDNVVPVMIVPTVRTGGDYGITANVENISTAGELFSSTVTFWGVPGDPGHDDQRCTYLHNVENSSLNGLCTGTSDEPSEAPHSFDLIPQAFLSLPTSCNGPETTVISMDSWQNPASFVSREVLSADGSGNPIGLDGCDALDFHPSISVAPDTTAADTPAGVTVDVRVPQGGLLQPEGLSAADIRDTVVTLPAGVAINPGQAAGLQACQSSEDGVGTESAPSCPNASRVGTVQIETPLLPDRLEGNVYVLQSNPPNLQLLVTASADGVNLKLIGDVHLDVSTGQLTTTFTHTPQLPFTDFKLSFSGGAQAALATPLSCGLYTTTSDFTPWSTPFTPDAFPSDHFAISSGPGGGACPSSPAPFSPTMIAGSTTDQAGGFTNFSLLLQRGDGQQRVEKLQFKTPKGLLGMISQVSLCGEPQAGEGKCSPASQIGHTIVTAGPGPYPLVVPQPGQPPAPIYLTGAYKGAPYGLSIVVPVVAGPFNLGTIVVRSRIEVDPHTSQLTVTTDPLPSIIDGIPTDLRTINAVIDRPNFMFNPTNCNPQSFSGTAFSTEGATAPISSHFQVGSCRSLAFKPNFKVSTSGKTSRANGASLDAKILYPTGPLGANQASSQSNVASVKVNLPKQLPSRLTTLQKACPAATFEADPANCPAPSVVGHASAITPILPVTLTGPAYFVSHGGEAFPSLIVVLQGYGVTVDLVGSTFISKAGITSSTFKQVPDVPISSFELTLPQGKYSALAANGNLCKSKLTMPTAFTAQDGAVIHQSTPITVTSCKPAINVLRYSVKGNTATIVVGVPSTGRLTASGAGLSRAVGRAGSAGTVTVALTLSKGEQRFLSRHRGHRLKATVKLLFTPTHGATLSSSVTVLMG